MRKIVCFFSVIVLLCACNRRGISPQGITFYCGDSIQLMVDGLAAIGFRSEDPFVASVDDQGIVKGRHIGTTQVYQAANVASAAVCSVVVKPRYEYFEEPLLDWDMTQEQLLNMLGVPTDTMLRANQLLYLYGDFYSERYATGYVFVGNKLQSALIITNQLTFLQVQDFLDERYAIDTETTIEDIPEDYKGLSYRDADNGELASLYVQVDHSISEHLTQVSYFRY